MTLRLDAKERVMRLIVPARCSLKKAGRFARQHEDWISSTMAALPPPVPFEDGAVIPVLGQLRRLHFVHDPDSARTSVDFQDKHIIVRTAHTDPAGRLTSFLKKLSRDHMTPVANEKAGKIGRQIARLSIRDTKSRWGSCSEGGNISLSWRLIFAPYEAMDYVIAHEVAHLAHLDHSKAFWALCRDLSDDFLEGQYWMKNHSRELMAYGCFS